MKLVTGMNRTITREFAPINFSLYGETFYPEAVTIGSQVLLKDALNRRPTCDGDNSS